MTMGVGRTGHGGTDDIGGTTGCCWVIMIVAAVAAILPVHLVFHAGVVVR